MNDLLLFPYLIVWERDLDHLVGVTPLAGTHHDRRGTAAAVGQRPPVTSFGLGHDFLLAANDELCAVPVSRVTPVERVGIAGVGVGGGGGPLFGGPAAGQQVVEQGGAAKRINNKLTDSQLILDMIPTCARRCRRGRRRR